MQFFVQFPRKVLKIHGMTKLIASETLRLYILYQVKAGLSVGLVQLYS